VGDDPPGIAVFTARQELPRFPFLDNFRVADNLSKIGPRTRKMGVLQCFKVNLVIIVAEWRCRSWTIWLNFPKKLV